MGQLDSQPDPFSVSMVFLRVGWMDHFRGLTPADQITGGGRFVEEHGYGYEIFNFQEHEGRVYGFVQPPRGSAASSTPSRINIGRLGASSEDKSVSNVLAVWVANVPSTHECVIVGWYEKATVNRDYQQSPPEANRTHEDKEFGYYLSAASADAALLPREERLFPIPTGGKGNMGQSNVWYADDGAAHGEIRRQVLNYVASRELPSPPPSGVNTGGARQADPLLHQKIEKAAVEQSTKYFTSIGYTVDSFEKDNVGWDLETVRGQIKLRLEVKGLSGSKLCVELTPNEYAMMREYRDSYRVCVVTNALTDPQLYVFAFSRDSKRWEDQVGRPLLIEEIVSVRCRAS